ncbi:Tektin [Diplonema papillatum]|nr:Tektin [Diplonema papillatum]
MLSSSPLLTVSPAPALRTQLASPMMARVTDRDNWNSAAEGLVKIADLGTSVGKALRSETAKLDGQLNRVVKQKSTHVEGMLKQKMHTTKQLCVALSNQLENTRHAAQTLATAAEKAADTAAVLQKPLKGTAARQTLRTARTEKERFAEEIDQYLSKEAALLKRGVAQLLDLVQQSSAKQRALSETEALLESDLADKSRALDIDLQCLVTGPAVAEQPPVDKRELYRSVNQGVLSSKSPFLPSIWKHSTEQTLAAALSAEEEARTVAARIHEVVHEVRCGHSDNRSSTFAAIKDKVRQATHLRQTILAKIAGLNGELSSLDDQRAHLKKSLAGKQAPLSVLQQRVAVRRQRPEREATSDEVEAALHGELAELMNSVNLLNDKVEAIEAEMRKLKASKKFLSIDLRDKNRTLKIDKRCLDLVDGASTPAISEDLTSLSSAASATRNHKYALHILNAVKPRTPCPPEIHKATRLGKRQYPKQTRLMTVGS